MKKLLVVLVCVVVLLVGCGAGYESEEEDTFYTEEEDTFYTVVYSDSSYLIVFDNYTKVMYHMSDGMYNIGTLTPLYNADGTLRVWEE